MLCLFLATPADPGADAVTALAAQVAPKAERLSAKLAACRAAGQDIAEPDAALAVAELFLSYARYDATQPTLRAAALRSLRYVDTMLDEELARADRVLAGQAAYPRIPQPRTLGVTWHDGSFWSGDQPVFLSGFNWDAGLAEHQPELLRRLGGNLADGMLRGGLRPDGTVDDGWLRGGDGTYLAKLSETGLPADCLLGLRPPDWRLKATPELVQRGYGNGYDYLVDHPTALADVVLQLDQLIPRYAANPALFAVDLANEPAFQGTSPWLTARWHEWLQRKYGTIDALNAAWGSTHSSFAQVGRFPNQPETVKSQWDRAKVEFDRPGVRGALYDANAFNHERVSAYFAELARHIKAGAPRVATHVKVMMGLYFTGSTESRGWPMSLSYHTFGLDPEALARSCDLLGGDLGLGDLSRVEHPNRFYGSVPYAMDWLNAELAQDFLTSLAPDKPYYNSEFHAVDVDAGVGVDPSGRDHIIAALWLAHLHGLRGNLLWYWGRGGDGAPMGHGLSWFTDSLLQQPWTLRGYAQESLTLRRFVPEVLAFAREPRRVRLLYSEASAIQDVHYLDALRDSYEALNFLGVPIGLLTENQLAAGVPADTRLVIVPRAAYVQDTTRPALRAAQARGVRVGVIGDSLSLSPTGRPSADAALPGALTAAVGTPQTYQPCFDGWLREAGIERELTAQDDAGHPAWGIEVRTARLGARRLAHLVNLMRTPVTVRLRWRAAGVLHDLRTDATVPDTVTLQPRQVVFGVVGPLP